MIIIVFGLPGSGKSYFASKLAAKMDASYISSDIIRREVLIKSSYSKEEKDKVYYAMIKKMNQNRIHHKDCVIDATFHKKWRREIFLNELSNDEQINFIEVWADEGLIRSRLGQKRKNSEANYEIYALIKQQWEPLRFQHLRLKSTNTNINYLLQTTINFLDSHDMLASGRTYRI